jgi:hypothetical protein
MKISPVKTFRNKKFFLLFTPFLFIFSFLLLFSFNYPGRGYKLAAESIQKSCSNSKYKDSCYAEKFYNLSLSRPFSFTHGVLEELDKLDNTVSDCHFIAHSIALAEVIKNPEGWMSLFKTLDISECSNGFMHGIIEGRGRADKNFTINPDTAYAICKEIEINRPDKAYFDIHKNCIHTIGHLILVQEGGDVDKSVNICNALTEDSKLHCLIAVFMENLQQQNLRVHDIRNSLIFDDTGKKEEINRCRKYTGIASEACWQNISWLFNKVNEFNKNKLYEDCSNAPDELTLAKCYSWGASVMSLYRLSGKVSEKSIEGICDPLVGKKDSYMRCVKGVAGYVILANSKFLPDIKSFCSSLEEEYQGICFAEIGSSPATKDGIDLPVP